MEHERLAHERIHRIAVGIISISEHGQCFAIKCAVCRFIHILKGRGHIFPHDRRLERIHIVFGQLVDLGRPAAVYKSADQHRRNNKDEHDRPAQSK